jgi:hypothetical protein
MSQQKSAVRLRIRTNEDTVRWIIGGTRYSRTRAHQDAEALRERGHVVHVDEADWYR